MNFEDICEKYRTWVIRLSSNSLSTPVFLIWLTDTTDEDEDEDKLVVSSLNKIIASDNFDHLVEELLRIKSILPDPVNTLTWLDDVQGLECTPVNYELESIEESIRFKAFNKKSINEAVNFINLCGDFDEQTGDQEIRNLRNRSNIKRLWQYGYDEIFWKELGLKEEIEPIRLPELQTNTELLNNEMSQLIGAFLGKLEIVKR